MYLSEPHMFQMPSQIRTMIEIIDELADPQ